MGGARQLGPSLGPSSQASPGPTSPPLNLPLPPSPQPWKENSRKKPQKQVQKLKKNPKKLSVRRGLKKVKRIVKKPIELHAKKNKNYPKIQSNPITPIKVANTRKKVVFAPYLKKFVDYIISFTGTKINMYRGRKDEILDWQEGGVKPEWAGLLFPAVVGHDPGPGLDIKYGTSEIYSENMSIFKKQWYINAVNTVTYTKCDVDVAGVIADNNKGDKVIEGSFDDIIDGNPGNWCGKYGKGKGNTANSNLIHNLIHKYTSNSTLIGNNSVHLVHWSRVSKPWLMVFESHEVAVTVKQHVFVNTVAQNKQHALGMWMAPTHMLTALSWSAAWSVGVSEGELVMALNPDLQKFQTLQTLATSTWSDLRSSAASLTSRGSESRSSPPSKSGPRTMSQSCDLKQGKDLQNNISLTTQYPKTHGLPKPTITPLTVRQVPWVLATVREGESLTKGANKKFNYSARNNVGLAGEWKYHLPKKGPKDYYRLVWVD